MTFADHSRPLLVVCHKWVNEEANTDLSIITELIIQCFVLIIEVGEFESCASVFSAWQQIIARPNPLRDLQKFP